MPICIRVTKVWFWFMWCVFAAVSKVSPLISPGSFVLQATTNLERNREGDLARTILRGREGPWKREHLKEQVCHQGALMTDCVSLFWLEISFNMHDKRRPYGTLPGNSAASPLQTPAVSALHRFIISGSYLTVWTQIPDWTLSFLHFCAVCWKVCTKALDSAGKNAK